MTFAVVPVMRRNGSKGAVNLLSKSMAVELGPDEFITGVEFPVDGGRTV